MRKLTSCLLFAFILLWGAMTARALYAQGDQVQSGSMGHGMMGDSNVKGAGGMMGMTKHGGQMMDHCSNMMNDNHPNDQWRKNTPSEPEKGK
jgi:hypothetical protein